MILILHKATNIFRKPGPKMEIKDKDLYLKLFNEPISNPKNKLLLKPENLNEMPKIASWPQMEWRATVYRVYYCGPNCKILQNYKSNIVIK